MSGSPKMPGRPPLESHGTAAADGASYEGGWGAAPWLKWPGIPADAVKITIVNDDGAYLYEERVFNRYRIVPAPDRNESVREIWERRTRELGGGQCAHEVRYQWVHRPAFAVEIWVENWIVDKRAREHYESVLGTQFDATQEWESATAPTVDQSKHAATWAVGSGLSGLAIWMGANKASGGLAIVPGAAFFLTTRLMASWNDYGGTPYTPTGWREEGWFLGEPDVDRSDDRWHQVGEPFPCPGDVEEPPEEDPQEDDPEEPESGDGEQGKPQEPDGEQGPAGWRPPWWWVAGGLGFLVLLLLVLWAMRLGDPELVVGSGDVPTGTPAADPSTPTPTSGVARPAGLELGQVHGPGRVQRSFGWVFADRGVTVDRDAAYDEVYAGSWAGSAVWFNVNGPQGAIPLIGDGGQDALRAVHEAFEAHVSTGAGGLSVDWDGLLRALGADAARVCAGRVVLQTEVSGGRMPGFDADGRMSGSGVFQGEAGSCGRDFPIRLEASLD